MKATQEDFTGQMIHVGIDTHLKDWKVSVWTDLGEYQTYCQPPEVQVLYRYLASRFPGAIYRCVYEAGFGGFWIARELEALGVECWVVAPADVPTTSKERCYKKDPRDAKKLARELRKGDLQPIYVPTLEEQSNRDLVRNKGRIVGKTTRVKNQIKSLLHFHGIQIPERFARRCWSGNFLVWLTTIASQESDQLGEGSQRELALLLEELTFYRHLLLKADRQVREMITTERIREDFQLVRTIPGIGPTGAATVITELMNISRFAKEGHMASYFGLVPCSHGSGERERDGGLTFRCNRRLRYVIIESAWRAIRIDASLMADYNRLCRRMKKQQAIIRIARKQMARLRYVLLNKEALQWQLPLAA